jgi:hypothetical protein
MNDHHHRRLVDAVPADGPQHSKTVPQLLAVKGTYRFGVAEVGHHEPAIGPETIARANQALPDLRVLSR